MRFTISGSNYIKGGACAKSCDHCGVHFGSPGTASSQSVDPLDLLRHVLKFKGTVFTPANPSCTSGLPWTTPRVRRVWRV